MIGRIMPLDPPARGTPIRVLKFAWATFAVVWATPPARAATPVATANPPPVPEVVQSSIRSVRPSRVGFAQPEALAVDATSWPVPNAATIRQSSAGVTIAGTATVVSATGSVVPKKLFHGLPVATHPRTIIIR